jgi:hypothetical protein
VRVLLYLLAGGVVWVVALSVGLASALTGTSGDYSPGGFEPGVELGLDAEQEHNAAVSLRVSDELHSPPLAVLAMMVAALGESDLRVVANAHGSGYCGVYQADPRNVDCNDTELQARSFQSGGRGFQAGGATQLARAQPSLTPGTIAYMVEGSRQNFTSDAEAARHYDVHRAEAERIIALWRSGGVDSLPASTGGRDIIAEADRMISLHQPYTWGGGHLAFSRDGPWDCSGAVSWLVHYLGLLDGRPLTSGEFEGEGRPGRGRVFTIYANSEHVFLIVEQGAHKGDAWGTATRDLEGAQGSGPLWHRHTTGNFVARHYEGW